jgi:hypothetical protein
MDQQWLGEWIQPQHLTQTALDAYHEAFVSHPSRLLLLPNFLNSSVVESLSRFLLSEAKFENLFGLYSACGKNRFGTAVVTEEEWLSADEKDRFYLMQRFVGVQPDSKLSPNLLTFLRFRRAFNDLRFRQFFQKVSGLIFDLESSTFDAFRLSRENFLRKHSDTAGKYRLAFIFYVSPEWKPCFGGALHMIGRDGSETKIEAAHNGLVIFDVEAKTRHYVAAIAPCAGETPRLSISGWLHKPE